MSRANLKPAFARLYVARQVQKGQISLQEAVQRLEKVRASHSAAPICADPNFCTLPPLPPPPAWPPKPPPPPPAWFPNATDPAANWVEEPPNLPAPTNIITLAETDPAIFERNSLLGQFRFLSPEGGMLIVGPSGIGKSSFGMQLDILWSLGKRAFGIPPKRPLRILCIQAENDDGDLSEMARGICGHLNLSTAERQQVAENVIYIKEKACTGKSFLFLLRLLVEKYRPDIVRIDPLQAFTGGDVIDAEITSSFLRNGLNPILVEFQCAGIISHHTPKTINRDTREWRPSDWMYAGAGHAEMSNWARAILVIDPTYAPGIFWLHAGKRGSRIGWTDEEGNRITKRLFCHHGGDAISWRDATEEDEQRLALAKPARGKQPTHNKEEMLALVPADQDIGKNELLARARMRGIGKNKAYEMLALLITDGQLMESKLRREGGKPPEVRVSRPPYQNPLL